jgi:hypothetical protein
MPYLHHSCAALRIGGDSLKPDEISRTLSCRPTLSFVKGQTEPSRGKAIVRETGGWHLDAVEQQPGNLDAHVAELFGRVNNDLSAWATLSGEYKIDLFCVYFMGEGDEVVQASAETLKVLGNRGVKLGLRIYSPAEEDGN